MNIKDGMKNQVNQTKSSDSLAEYPVKSVDVQVCGQLYNELKVKKSLYRETPEDGIPARIDYADTLDTTDTEGNVIQRDSPTVLLLHGAPGSHRDFKYLIQQLQASGHRVIAPNFPDYKMTTKTRVFRHSGQEKKEYIKAFLNAIHVNRCVSFNERHVLPQGFIFSIN